MELVLLCQNVMTQGFNENLEVPGGCEAPIEFCDVVFKTRPEIAGALSHALVWVFEFFKTMKLWIVRPRMAKYDIIVDSNGNEVVLKISNHLVVKSPFTTVNLDVYCSINNFLIVRYNDKYHWDDDDDLDRYDDSDDDDIDK